MKIKIIIAVFLLCGTVSSCKKYLQEKSDKTLVVPSTLDDLQALMDDDYNMNCGTSGFGQNSDDDFFMTPDTYNAVQDIDRLVYTWRLRTYKYSNGWATGYLPVYQSNYCLDNIGKIEKSTQNEIKWNNVYGSAHFYRGYYYLNLAWEFGKAYDEATADTDLGIVLRSGSDFNVPSVRATIRQTYQQIIADLKEAGDYLPASSIHPLRPSKAAAYGTLARAYLSMGEYDSAYKYADMSLQLKNDVLDFNSPEVDPTSPVPFQPYNHEIVFHTRQSFSFAPILYFYSFTDTSLFASYNDNDLRKTVFYFPQGGYQSFKGGYAGDPFYFFSGITTAEMLLTRAECHARANRLAEAAADLDAVLRNRWLTGTYVPASFTSMAQAVPAILLERRKELTMRGLRWIDIKRLNKEDANIILTRKIGPETFTLPPNDSRYALPIPQDIIDITGIPQN